MILYKYLQPSRLDVLKEKRIRFTQPGDFNDPFEGRPPIREVANDAFIKAHVEEHFEKLVDEELDRYGALPGGIPRDELRSMLVNQKHLLPTLFQLLEPDVIQTVSPEIYGLLNLNVGILCLSEIRDSILMWGHYTDNHQGFAVGFDSSHPFFSKRRSDKDEFGVLRRVEYSALRPQVTLTDVTSTAWFLTKSEHWSYEKEWRILRPLLEAGSRIEGPQHPICLFDFPVDAVREIIVGMRSDSLLNEEIRSLAPDFPRVELFEAFDDSGYNVAIRKVR